MPHSHRRRIWFRHCSPTYLQRLLETLESRVLLTGNSYAIGTYSFSGSLGGSSPYGGLVADSQGDLFGTTNLGGANGTGTIFELPASGGGAVTLYSFGSSPSGANSHAGLTIDASGNLFGVTYGGGANSDGTIFEIPAGSFSPTILHSFTGTDGASPYGGLILDSAGNLYGTTVNGGAHSQGSVFELTAGGTLFTLYSFNGTSDGANPYGPLLRDAAGDLYGTTWAGGSSGAGTVWKITSSGFQSLKSFAGTDGAKPAAQLTMDAQGNIFGLTQAGGTYNDGTIFGIAAGSTTVVTLYSFTGGIDGASPYGGLVADSNGDFFGTTFKGGAHGDGTVYEIPVDSTVPETLYSFTGGNDGAAPFSAILIRGNGILYGTTTAGGANSAGVIYRLTPTLTTQLAAGQQPSNIVAGGTINPSVVVDLDLGGGAINTSDISSVTLSIVSGPSGGTLTGTASVQAKNGVATFSNLQLTRAGTYTLAAADGSLTPVTLDSFVVSPGTASRLAYVQQPTSIVAGQTLTPGVALDVLDAYGNIVTSNSSTITLALQGGSATLSGTLAVQAISGVATFSDLSATKVGTYTLLASDGGLPTLKSTSFTVLPDIASAQLGVLRQPGNAVVGKASSPSLVVGVVDQYNNIMTTNTSQAVVSLVVLSLGGNATAATLTGTSTLRLVKGQATFANLAISQPGSYALQVSDGTFSAVTTQSILNSYVPTHLVFTQQPARTTIAGAVIAPAITVAIEDSSKRIDTANNSLVTLTLTGHTNSTISGTLVAQAIYGVATFSGLTMDQAGSYVLQAASGTLTSAKSASFVIAPQTSSSHLVLVTKPNATLVGRSLLPNLVVKDVDQFGNPVTQDHSRIILTTTAGTFTGHSTVTLSNATATFSNIIFKTAGTYTLLATPATNSTLANAAPIIFSQTVQAAATNPIRTPALKATGYAYAGTLVWSTAITSDAPSSIPFTRTPMLVINGTDNVPATAFSAAGLAKFAMPLLDVGTYSCQIAYPGDINHSSANSATFTLTINPAATTTALSESPASLVFGQALTLTALVKAAGSVTRPGSVEFMEDGNPLQTVALNASSSATITYTPAATGSHTYQALYVATPDFLGSTSATLKRIVSRDKDTTLLSTTAAGPLSTNETFNLTVQVSVLAAGGGVVTGDPVTILDNGKLLGTLTLDSTSAGTLSGLSYSASGSHILTAIFPGDPDTLPSTSPKLKLTVA